MKRNIDQALAFIRSIYGCDVQGYNSPVALISLASITGHVRQLSISDFKPDSPNKDEAMKVARALSTIGNELMEYLDEENS